MSDIKKVTIVTPEFYGDTMVGGLAVSVHGLSHALSRLGIDVNVILPSYQKNLNSDKFVNEPFIESNQEDKIHSQRVDGIMVHKITGNNYLNLKVSPYLEHMAIESSAYKEANLKSFESHQLFSSTIPNVLKNLGLGDSDVIHLMEWSTAGAAFYLRQESDFSKTPIVLTSHNLNYAGEVPSHMDGKTYFGSDSNLSKNRVFALSDDQGNLFGSLLELGIHYSDFVNTVSPTEAKEVLKGRDGVNKRIVHSLQKKGLTGILNGVNSSIINPETDPFIDKFHTKTYKSISNGKKDNKKRLKSSEYGEFRKLELEKPLVSMMCRLANQKSIEEVIESAKDLDNNLQLAIVGEPQNGEVRRKLYFGLEANSKPNVIVYHSFAKPDLQHMVLASSDAILQPSKWEPCGYTQLEGMVYGAIPIVTNVGGYIDTVTNLETSEGFGIFIDDPTIENVTQALKKFESLYDNSAQFEHAVLTATGKDFSWNGPENSVRKYLELYQKAIDKHNPPEKNTEKMKTVVSKS